MTKALFKQCLYLELFIVYGCFSSVPLVDIKMVRNVTHHPETLEGKPTLSVVLVNVWSVLGWKKQIWLHIFAFNVEHMLCGISNKEITNIKTLKIRSVFR